MTDGDAQRRVDWELWAFWDISHVRAGASLDTLEGLGESWMCAAKPRGGYGKRRFGDCFLPHAIRSLHDAHGAHDALAAAVDGWFLAP